MPSRHKSPACADYVPALCTHRPSLLPIEWLSEAFGLAQEGWQRSARAGKLVKLGHLEEVKVVTRFSYQRLQAATVRNKCLQFTQVSDIAKLAGTYIVVPAAKA